MLKKIAYLPFIAVALIPLTLTANAQSTPAPTLRALADQNHIHIGAAVYSTHLDDPAFAQTLSREFNMLTPENEAKFCEIQPQRDKFDFTGFDRIVAFAEANDMQIHGHNLVWHQCLPDWVAQGNFSRDEAIQILHDHIFTLLGRYRGRVPIWDVVNEAISDSGSGLRDTPWRQMIGDDYVEIAFRLAHEADPDALLFYNDYSAEAMTGKSNAVYDMVADFVKRGVPINGVGLQAHFTLGGVNAGSISQNIKRLGDLGLQVQITEMDDRFDGAPSDDKLQKQADDYRQLMQVCLDNSNCTAFITWGVSDNYTWLRDSNLGFFKNPLVAPLLFDDQSQPKPAYQALIDVLTKHAG
jgi:endo-1,4-beta-xylanase